MTTARLFGMYSLAMNVRPNSGRTPRISKKFSDTDCTITSSGSDSPESVTL
jgi:hypothetical protein